MPADPKRALRTVDRMAVRTAALKLRACAACGGTGATQHHVVPRGGPHYGDDVIENLVALCGSGTTGCHGAMHGCTVTVTVETLEGTWIERRDRAWVARRVGETIRRTRPDVIAYVLGRLGPTMGPAFLEDAYMISLAA